VKKIFLKSGISTTATYLPACIQPTHTDDPKTDLDNAQKEARMVFTQVVDTVLRKTGEGGRGQSHRVRGEQGGQGQAGGRVEGW
jgi:hypothetical protein